MKTYDTLAIIKFVILISILSTMYHDHDPLTLKGHGNNKNKNNT